MFALGAGVGEAIGDGFVPAIEAGLATASMIGATAYASPLILHDVNNVMIFVIRRGDIKAAPIACGRHFHCSIILDTSM